MGAERPIAVRVAEARWPAETAAAAALFREYGHYAAALGYDLGFQGFAAELAGLPGPYARPRGLLLLAWSGAEAAGCAGYRPLAEGICEMKRLYVRPVFRGHGIGELLCRELIREARACGYRAMRLDTGAAMHSARRLYAALGFTPIPPYYETPYETLCFELSLIAPAETIR
ncbi:MAG TPA: GNAT family N-acetyltransferase [Stellaceae bacterium]|nr:GNAT family N-acetyltransferase [Stellaceae bacterium]